MKLNKCLTKYQYRSWMFLWVIFYFLFLHNLSYAKNYLSKIGGKWENAYSVKYYKSTNEYKTYSRVVGEQKYIPHQQEILLKSYGNDKIKLNFYSYQEFEKKIKKRLENIEYYKNFDVILNNYLKFMEINYSQLTFNIIIIPSGYEMLYESKKIKVSNVLELKFVTKMKIEHENQQTELSLVKSLPHELFHFLVDYADFGRMNLLRNETYAHLFGQCVSYELNPVIQDNIKLNFPDYFFKEPKEDFKKVLKKLKKSALVKENKFPKSHFGHGLSRYYFQAVADERNGDRISSEKIPKFCHKLFLEHDFKHPIEKKPPKWFKEFLQQ